MTIPDSELTMAQMMQRPLLLSSILTYAEKAFPYQEIVTREASGICRASFEEFCWRCRKLATALTEALGVKPGSRVGTLAWNTMAHMELYFAIPSIGSVCHTLNPRYSDEQLVFIINRAGNRVIFADASILPRLATLVDRCPTIEKIVLIGEGGDETCAGIDTFEYDTIVESGNPLAEWPEFNEQAASSLCYSSGSTGDPKGALYSHRSTILYSLSSLASGQTRLAPTTTALSAVPMFHVNGWCRPHQALLSGAKLVLPGSQLAGNTLNTLIHSENVTCAYGVPTIWLSYVEHLRQSGETPGPLSYIGFGGGSPTKGLMKALADYGIDARCGYGMTETTTGLAAGCDGPDFDTANENERLNLARLQRQFYGIDIQARTEDGSLAPRDGITSGEMECRGHFVISGYYQDESASKAALTKDGWFKTGDVVTIDSYSRLQVVDRVKDMIKSGGEWISSQLIESVASTHPDVAEAAVIGIPHARWTERPLLLLRLKQDTALDRPDILQHLEKSLQKWWVPDAIDVVETIPRASTGKVDKRALRQTYAGWSYSETGDILKPDQT